MVDENVMNRLEFHHFAHAAVADAELVEEREGFLDYAFALGPILQVENA